MSEWISVEDRLPDRDQKILCHEPLVINGLYDWDGASLIDHGPDVTHWMPLPEPPKNNISKPEPKIALGNHDFPISTKSTVYPEG